MVLFCVQYCVCRKCLSSPSCRSELIDSTWVVIVPGQKCINKKKRRKRKANGSKPVFNDDQDEPSDCNDLVTNEPVGFVYDDTSTNEIKPSVCKRKNKKSEPGKDENGRSFNYTLTNEKGHEELVCQKFFLRGKTPYLGVFPLKYAWILQ